jgi:hypothetical protein
MKEIVGLTIFLGAAKGPITFLTCKVNSFANSGSSVDFESYSGFIQTKACTACPVTSSAHPTTAVSATPLWRIRADSTSAVESRWPDTLITSGC